MGTRTVWWRRSEIAAMLLLAWPVQGAAQDPVYRRYTRDDGLPSNMVYCAMQDRDGFMWFATDAGVSRFDGHSFTNYGLSDGVMDNEVIWCQQDSRGRIWLLLLNGKLCYYLDGRFHNERTDPWLHLEHPSAGWHSMVEEADGHIWMGGISGGLLRLRPDLHVDTLLHFKGDAVGVFSVAHDRNGEVLIWRSGKVCRWRDRRLEVLYELNDLGLGALFHDPPARGLDPLLITRDGIVGMRPTGAVPIGARHERDLAISNRCWYDREGNIWIHRKDRGIELVPEEGGAHGTVRILFGEENVNNMMLDRSGNQWFCTQHGVLLSTSAERSTRVFLGSGRE
ncbi:MAG TPA: two-component regulator propeller domain-containing protein, partial [Flavobacteriales bacterium]|nr:two-component regulator propeller domain-containing protein [Flavobacteriales bacterium]